MERIELFQAMYTDFTELKFADGRHKASLTPIIAHVSKVAYGWSVGTTSDTVLGLQVWQRAKETLHQLGVRWEGMILHHDRDAVFTSYQWAAQLLLDGGVRLSYALHGAKDNPQIESFHSWFKPKATSCSWMRRPLLSWLEWWRNGCTTITRNGAIRPWTIWLPWRTWSGCGRTW
jgi:hypothetical protein